MYEDNKYSFNWIKIGLRIILVLLIIVLSIKLIMVLSNKDDNSYKDDTKLATALKNMDLYAKEYFKDDKLPTKVGESITVTLEELIEKEKYEEIKDSKDNKCNYKESYIKVTKLDKEYQIKSNLVCDNYDDYINSFIESDSKEIVETSTTTTTTTTTKKVTTTQQIKKYKVSYNTNGGNQISPSTIVSGQALRNIEMPTREGYKFIGWFYHGTEFDINTKITSDIVLVAKWVKE